MSNKDTEKQEQGNESQLEDLEPDEAKMEQVKGGPTFAGWLPAM